MKCFGGRGEKKMERKYKQWNTYAISCYENCGNCCCCLVCCPFAITEIYHYACSLPWSIAFLFSIILLPFHMCTILILRQRVRRAHRIEGNCISDLCCLMCCCWPTIICQLRDQILHLRSKAEWKLGYSERLDDKPPWVKLFSKLKRKKRNKDEESATNSDDDVEDDNDENDEDENQDEDTDQEDSEDEADQSKSSSRKK
uniref:Uncharacterized protein n=1 Tax=Trichobilharzia regenti TaxID=157069 RepID=A0AA85JH18_TRIRE|nr:unnamed protein product [Trichobilharzia regenti]